VGRSIHNSADTIVTPAEHKLWTKLTKSFIEFNEPVTFKTGFRSFEKNGLEQLHALSYQHNTVLEIRDVRIPNSSHHPSLTRLCKHRNHMICYTHSDLLSEEDVQKVREWTSREWPDASYMFLDVRESRSDFREHYDFYTWITSTLDAVGGENCALTFGIPNVGKSAALLGLLRWNKKVMIRKETGAGKKVGRGYKPEIEDRPGKTKEIVQYVLRDKPRLYCLDVPGLTPPAYYFLEYPDSFYGLCAAGCLDMGRKPSKGKVLEYRDGDYENLLRPTVAYALERMNKAGNFRYVKKIGLSQPTDDPQVAIRACVAGKALRKKVGREEWQTYHFDMDTMVGAARRFLHLLGNGNFGSVILDDLGKKHHGFYASKKKSGPGRRR
jgi:ribosome biogenesis GTPase A